MIFDGGCCSPSLLQSGISQILCCPQTEILIHRQTTYHESTEISVSSNASSGSRNSWMIVAVVDIIADFASHQLYFIRGEHHINASILLYSYTALAVAVFFLELWIDETYRGAVQNTTLHICAYTLMLFTSIIIYRVCFHPLHSFPGPFLARVSKFWHVYQARYSQNHQLLLRLYNEYGPFIRTGKQTT